ncbi:hypothetical protein AnigIFM56816_005979 [Aspergillus niger]|nr:hypothetical protein AnigIFM56816_005979 [Aspergillus niger]
MNLAQFGDLIESIKSLIFFGTPHQGADIATWVTFLTNVSRAIGIKSSDVLQELQRWSNSLLDLNRLFSQQIADLKVTTFFELEDTYGVRVVPEGSARLSNLKWETSQGLHRNHLNICKFAREDESDFRSVKARFHAIGTEIMAEAAPMSCNLPVASTAAISHLGAQEAEEERDKKLQERFNALQASN